MFNIMKGEWEKYKDKVDNNSREIAQLKNENASLKEEVLKLRKAKQKMEVFLCVKFPKAPFCY